MNERIKNDSQNDWLCSPHALGGGNINQQLVDFVDLTFFGGTSFVHYFISLPKFSSVLHFTFFVITANR